MRHQKKRKHTKSDGTIWTGWDDLTTLLFALIGAVLAALAMGLPRL